MKVIKLVCAERYGYTSELDVTPDRFDNFPTIYKHLKPGTNVIELDFSEKIVRHVLGLPAKDQCNNPRLQYYRYNKSDRGELYRFYCKYNGKQLDSIEEKLLEDDAEYDDCIYAEIFNTAYMYNRPAIVKYVNDMLREDSLDVYYAQYSYNDSNLDAVDADLKFDMILFEHEADSNWIFNTMNRICKSGCVVTSRHLESLNKLLLEAHNDKKIEFYEDDVDTFIKFITDQGFNSKEKINKKRCMCYNEYHDYDCFGRYYKFYI